MTIDRLHYKNIVVVLIKITTFLDDKLGIMYSSLMLDGNIFVDELCQNKDLFLVIGMQKISHAEA